MTLPTVHRFILCAALALLPGAWGCGDSATASDTGSGMDVADTGMDAPPGGRPFFMGGYAEGYDVTHPRQWVAASDTLGSGLAEVVVIPLDLLGVAWESFLGLDNRISNPPGVWLSAVSDLKARAAALGLPVVLRLTPLAPFWDTLAPAPRDDTAELVLNPSWLPGNNDDCYDASQDGDPAKWRDAFAGYAVWAVEQFDPDWVILGTRLNRYEENCGPSPYAAVQTFVAEAHARVSALDSPPKTIVTVDVEDLYGYPKQPGRCVIDTPAACFDKRKGLLDGLTADILGLESYPAFALTDGLQTLPTDWLTRVADAKPQMTAAITGTSLPPFLMDSNLSTGVCLAFLDSSEERQRDWVDQVINAATTRQMPLVLWRSLVDLLDGAVIASCPCSGDPAICQHLSQRASRADDVRLMTAGGLVAKDGTERMGAALWRQAMTTVQ